MMPTLNQVRTTLDRWGIDFTSQPWQETLANFSIHARAYGASGTNAGKFVLKHGPLEVLNMLEKYPWMRDLFFNLGGFYDKVVNSRTGAYREASALIISTLSKILIEMIDGAMSHPETTILHEDMVSIDILKAMGLNPWMAEIMGMIMPMVCSQRNEFYIDASENSGIAPDTCGLPKSTMGMALSHHFPPPVAMIASNLPCDGGMTSYTLIEHELKVPTFRLDIPHHFKTERALDYFVGEFRRMIAWLEEHTPGRMDWDRLRDACEVRNRTLELELELWDLLRHKPAPLGGEPIIFGHLIFLFMMPGHPEGIPYFQKLLELAYRNLDRGRGALEEERFRYVLWNPEFLTFPDAFAWAEKTHGALCLMDMMSYNRHTFIDTSSQESILRGLSHVMMDGPMARHTRGPAENFFGDLFYLYEFFNLDMIWMADHVGCKNTKAMTGMFRERCRQKNIPLLFIQDDMSDSRIVSNDDMKQQIDNFMETIMKQRKK